MNQESVPDPKVVEEFKDAEMAWKWISFKLMNPEEAAGMLRQSARKGEWDAEWEDIGDSRNLDETVGSSSNQTQDTTGENPNRSSEEIVGNSSDETQDTASASVFQTARSVASDFGSVVMSFMVKMNQ